VGLSKGFFTLALFTLCVFPAFSQARTRSFESVYPQLAKNSAVYSGDGYTVIDEGKTSLGIVPRDTGFDFTGELAGCNPNYLVESVRVIKVNTTLLKVYNSFRRVRALKGLLYHSHRKDRDVPLFEEAYRTSGPGGAAALPDLAPASEPAAATSYMRLTDANFGVCFYEGQSSVSKNAVLFHLTNVKSISYGIIPVMGERKFIALIYAEPVDEGLLVYSVAAARAGFSFGIDIDSAIAKRLRVILDWMLSGL
jgi:hypothetical protein